MNTQIENALEIALAVHKGQVDKIGRPYILHVIRVASRTRNDVELVTALLHDVVEDSEGTLTVDYLLNDFPQNIVSAVDALSRREKEKYFDYIERLSKNPLALRIKLYDLEDNLNSHVHDFVGQESLFARYEKAYNILIGKIDKDYERYGY